MPRRLSGCPWWADRRADDPGDHGAPGCGVSLFTWSLRPLHSTRLTQAGLGVPRGDARGRPPGPAPTGRLASSLSGAATPTLPPPRPSGRHPPGVHVLQLRLLLPPELLQLQPLLRPQLGQLSPDLPVLLLGGGQPVGELLAEHLGQAAPLARQLLVHLVAGMAGAVSPCPWTEPEVDRSLRRQRGPGRPPARSPPSLRPGPCPSGAPGLAGARPRPRPPPAAPSAQCTGPAASAAPAPAPPAPPHAGLGGA